MKTADKQPQHLESWQALRALAGSTDARSLCSSSDDRFSDFSIETCGLLVDLSKQPISDEVRQALVALAYESLLPEAIDAQFQGDAINSSEDRAVLHTALRAPAELRPLLAREEVERELGHIATFANDIRSASRRGFTGKAFTDVVHVGIGGSHLGPDLIVDALGPGDGPRIHFLANVDGHALASLLPSLNPETTLVNIVSKSFTTAETHANANSLRSWFLERTGSTAAIANHFCAVSSNLEAVDAFGIERSNVFAMWDWVGGRYSVWSAVGLPIALALGNSAFREFLAGAHALDQHFRSAPLERNAPAMLALAGIWNSNFLATSSHAVLTYDQRLRLLPDYLQQLDMESNGKSVHRDGSAVSIDTAGVIWGGEETNGQHAYHQQLHQGTGRFSADFIACRQPAHDFDAHHAALLANCLAQSQAMLEGTEQGVAERFVPGNRATNTILIDALTPATLGALLALYEQKVFCQGVIWQINSFDQWGVELGKKLAAPIQNALSSSAAAAVEGTTFDVSTSGLIRHILDRQ